MNDIQTIFDTCSKYIDEDSKNKKHALDETFMFDTIHALASLHTDLREFRHGVINVMFAFTLCHEKKVKQNMYYWRIISIGEPIDQMLLNAIKNLLTTYWSAEARLRNCADNLLQICNELQIDIVDAINNMSIK